MGGNDAGGRVDVVVGMNIEGPFPCTDKAGQYHAPSPKTHRTEGGSKSNGMVGVYTPAHTQERERNTMDRACIGAL